MAFERFEYGGRSFVPKVSIWSRGQIGFSMGAVKRFELQKYQYVVFFYDTEARRIGFQFTLDKNETGAAKLNVRENGGVVGAKAFLDYYGLDYKKTRQFIMKEDQETGLLIIELDRGIHDEDDSDGEQVSESERSDMSFLD